MTGVDEVLKKALSKYKYADIAKRDVTNAINQFKDLRPSYNCFTFNDGTSKDLLNLDGTIRVQYKGSVYNIPVGIWILDTHPYNPPMVFVKPSSTMQIKPGRNVDSSGKVDLPYLRYWRYPQSDLLGLIQILLIVFGEDTPLYPRAARTTQSPTPYPGPSPTPYKPPLYQREDPATQSLPHYPGPGPTPYQTQTPYPMQEMEGVDRVLKQALSKYKYADIAKTDVTNAISQYKHLRPSHDSFTFNDSTSKDMLNLDGTIPLQYQGVKVCELIDLTKERNII